MSKQNPALTDLANREQIFGFLAVAGFCVVSVAFLDRPVARALATAPWFIHDAAAVLSAIGNPRILYPLAAAGLPAWWFLRSAHSRLARDVLFVSLSVLTIALMIAAFKFLAGRARPPLLLDGGIYGFFFFGTSFEMRSFPSGHTACAFAVAAALGRYLGGGRTAIIVLAALIGASRLGLGLHYLSDVAAGIYLGVLVPLVMRRFAVFSQVPSFTGRSPPAPERSG